MLVATLLRAMFAQREPVERERRPRHVAEDMLETLPIAAVDRDLRVHVHAAVLRERARVWAHRAHRLHELQRLSTGVVAEQL